jgi:hypothetical protein
MGIAGDRGWALRDETAGEIRGGKKMPVLMQCAARYDAEPTDGAIPPVTMTLPDGSTLRSGDADASERLSALTGPAPDAVAAAARRARRALPPRPAGRSRFRDELRQIFGRLPDEPLPDLSVIPQELFEYTSPLGTYFDLAPMHLLTTAHWRPSPRRLPARASTAGAFGRTADRAGRRRLGTGRIRLVRPHPARRRRVLRDHHSRHALQHDDPGGRRPTEGSLGAAHHRRDANQNLGVYATVVRRRGGGGDSWRWSRKQRQKAKTKAKPQRYGRNP